VAGGVFALALILYAVAYLIERGFTGLNKGTVIAAVATALLLAAVSVTIEQYIKAKLSDQEVNIALKCREFGIQNLEERSVSRGISLSPPHEVLKICRSEVLVIGYSADKFVEDCQPWIVEALDNGKYVGLLILHPEQLEQANQTETQRNIKPQIDKTLGYCKKFVAGSPKRAKHLRVRGYHGHFYFTGIFVDRSIVATSSASKNGPVRIQLKANFKSQHEGLLVAFNSNSRHATYYEESCREIWNQAEDLLNIKENAPSPNSG